MGTIISHVSEKRSNNTASILHSVISVSYLKPTTEGISLCALCVCVEYKHTHNGAMFDDVRALQRHAATPARIISDVY